MGATAPLLQDSGGPGGSGGPYWRTEPLPHERQKDALRIAVSFVIL